MNYWELLGVEPMLVSAVVLQMEPGEPQTSQTSPMAPWQRWDLQKGDDYWEMMRILEETHATRWCPHLVMWMLVYNPMKTVDITPTKTLVIGVINQLSYRTGGTTLQKIIIPWPLDSKLLGNDEGDFHIINFILKYGDFRNREQGRRNIGIW